MKVSKKKNKKFLQRKARIIFVLCLGIVFLSFGGTVWAGWKSGEFADNVVNPVKIEWEKFKEAGKKAPASPKPSLLPLPSSHPKQSENSGGGGSQPTSQLQEQNNLPANKEDSNQSQSDDWWKQALEQNQRMAEESKKKMEDFRKQSEQNMEDFANQAQQGKADFEAESQQRKEEFFKEHGITE